MSHTLPDYTTKYRMATVFGQIDNSELAARIGSVNTFDRRGNVVFIDDFEGSTLFWESATSGTDADVSIVADRGKLGSQSCKLTAGDGATGQAYIYRLLGAQVLGKLGIESSFTIDSDTTRVDLELRYYDGINYHSGMVRYVKASDKFQIWDTTLGYVDVLTSYSLDFLNTAFHTMKLVIDIDTKKYVRLLVNNQSIDLSAYTLKEYADATKTSIRFGIYHVSAEASAAPIWVDNIIITQNEP